MKTYRYLLFIGLIITVFSCKKDYDPASELSAMDDYIKTNKLVVTEATSSGLRYIRSTAGVGAAIASGQKVTVKYVGKLLSGKVFDQGTFSFNIGFGEAVKGFDEGIGKMRVGEKATIVFPSNLGYGASGTSGIPANSPLVFDIDVLSAR